MNKKIQELQQMLESAQSPNEAKQIMELLAEVERRHKREQQLNLEQKKPEESKRQQKKQQAKKQLKENQKKLDNFSSGLITWKRKNGAFYPTWNGYINNHHIFMMEQKLSKYELKIVDRTSFSTSFEEIQKQAEKILEKYITGVNKTLLENKKKK